MPSSSIISSSSWQAKQNQQRDPAGIGELLLRFADVQPIAAEAAGQQLNGAALACMAERDYESSLSLLQQAEEGTRLRSSRVITKNNRACVYRRLGEYKQAIRHLKTALEIGSACTDLEPLSAVHLNLSAILSEIGR
jgi:tetratricopeptide (TPR) repeat protein